MQPIKPKWLKSGLVLVCERCYKERIPEEDPEIAERIDGFNLRDWLKKELKEKGEWGPIRVIGTSCQDVCARGRVTVTIDSKADGESAEPFVVDAVEDRKELRDTIIDRLGKARRQPQ